MSLKLEWSINSNRVWEPLKCLNGPAHDHVRPPAKQRMLTRQFAIVRFRPCGTSGTGLALYIFAHVTLRLHAVKGGWTKLQWDQLLISAAMNVL